MKTIKKTFALLLALIMALGLSVSAFADEATTTYTITITNTESGHTYEAYQIFSGTLYNDALTDIKWGTGIKDGATLLTALQTDETISSDFSNCTTAAMVADVLANYSSSESYKLDAFAAVVNGNLAETPTGSTSEKTDSGYVIDNLPAGYYLVKDKDGSLDTTKGDTYTQYMLQVVGDVSVTAKSDTVASEKKVEDINDSKDYNAANATQEGWQDSADYDIGDAVPFQLTATLPSNYDSYEVYKLTFHDVESAGLTFNADSVKVYVDGTPITSGYAVITGTDTEDGCTFEIIFNDLKQVTSAEAGSTITVTYTSTLNSDAEIGSTGNPNKMHVEYSNNPNDDTSTGTTPDDMVTVFTYKLIVNKTDGTNALTGATFKLSKYDAKNEKWVEVGTIDGTSSSTFTWSGLDDGKYMLEETIVPDGYNPMEPQYFTITAEHDDLSDKPTLNDLSVEVDTSTTGYAIVADESFVKNLSEGSLTVAIENKKGTSLPSTGGIGTTIFYVVGGVLAVGAAILLIVKRRMNGDQD